MLRPALLAVCAAAITLAAPAHADSDGVSDHVEGATQSMMAPVRLVEWTGDFELLKVSRRMRIWRSHIAYELSVDAEGNVTGCELTETFRLRRVSDRLCDVLSAHHRFEPALDDAGEPTDGSYSARMSYAEIRERL